MEFYYRIIIIIIIIIIIFFELKSDLPEKCVDVFQKNREIVFRHICSRQQAGQFDCTRKSSAK